MTSIDCSSERDTLIPGLKDSLALQCLARVPRAHYPALRRVSRLWQSTVLGRHLYKLRKDLGLQEPWIYVPFSSSSSSSQLPLRRRVRTCSNWLEAYDPVEDVWHYIGAIPGTSPGEVLKGFAMVQIKDRLFIIGGKISTKDRGDIGVTRQVRVLNTVTGKWSRCASMSVPRVDFACTVCNGIIYAAGGRADLRHERGVDLAEAYVPQQNAWLPLPALKIARYNCVGVTLDGKIYVIGGFAYSGPHCSPVNTLDRSSAEVFDPEMGTWELSRAMWQVDVPPYQIIAVEGVLYSSGDVLHPWKGRVEQYDRGLNMWKIVDGSQLPQPVSRSETSSFWESCHKWQQSYLTVAQVGKSSLYFIGGYRKTADEYDEFRDGKRIMSRNSDRGSDSDAALEVVSVFETKDGRWRSSETVLSSAARKDLCGHCCTLAL